MTSTIKVNNVQNQCGQNIINENSNTITIGASGDTIALASGASQTGFGRNGAVNWQTSIKTTGFTAVSGEGYFCNTTAGAFTLTLPSSPSAGDIVAFKDYANTFDTNNLTIGRAGSNIGGVAVDGTIDSEGIAITLVYADATKGWLVTDSGLQSESPTAEFVTATGGNATLTCGDYKIHVFTGPGTFCVSGAGNASGSNKVSYMVVAGGGGGGGTNKQSRPGSAAGAGGFREGKAPAFESYTASPLVAADGLTVTATGFPIAVGAGGSGGVGTGGTSTPGGVSTFSTITSAGGGSGSSPSTCEHAAGGSGGAGRAGGPAGKSGNTPPVSPPQGNAGGNGGPCGPKYGSGGGGGATAAGSNGTASAGGAGGAGAGTAITTSSCYGTPGPSGSLRYYAGGAGGSIYGPGTIGAGGTGGGAAGIEGNPADTSNGGNGTANTGGGASAASGNVGFPSTNMTGGAGGSGIVIIRYKFQ